MTQAAAGYARCGTDEPLGAQRQAGVALGLPGATLGGPKLSASQHAQLTKLDAAHGQELTDPAKVFSASRPRAHRILARHQT